MNCMDNGHGLILPASSRNNHPNSNLRMKTQRFAIRLARPVASLFLLILFVLVHTAAFPQGRGIKWSKTGSSYYKIEKSEIVEYTLPANEPKVIVSKKQLTPEGAENPLKISWFSLSEDGKKILIFTNTKRVWRLNTKGDYWVLDLAAGTLKQLGKTLPASSLMFAKISPDSRLAAYVSGNNIYTEDLATSEVTRLTPDGSTTMINGTFDWVYEEEFACRDGFRWSPDSRSIAYWQVNAEKTRKFYMINNTDSVYSQLIPIEYPKVGQQPSPARVGIVRAAGGRTTWIQVPGDPAEHYIVRLEYIPGTSKLLLQQLNRKQNQSRLYIADETTGQTSLLQEEQDAAWVDVFQFGNPYTIDYTNSFNWIDEGGAILWDTEKDGWRRFWKIPVNGGPVTAVTGDYDITDLKHVDKKGGYVYYMASPDNATQSYLYRSRLDGKGKAELLSPAKMKGTHDYSFSADGKYASHTFSNHFTQPAREFIETDGHKPLVEKESIAARLDTLVKPAGTEFFRIKTADNIEVDGWMVKPKNFDPKKKYPVVFYVYTEPASTTVSDTWGAGNNGLYDGDMAEDGYLYVSLDNRGTPVAKGREWRKSIYRKIGQLNIRDQAMAAREVLKWDFVDTSRTAVWGWSGGGSATLNLMFQYPEIYKTGISIAALTSMLTYDNIYQERYMGLPQENMDDFINGSPITYAKNLRGNLLYIHGTGDDNVHYQNAEMLVNELVKHNKLFRFMPYPNRSHGIYEGEGTQEHLSNLYTSFLKENCPPGGR